MNPNLQSLILSTLLQGATKGKHVVFYWMSYVKKVTVKEVGNGIEVFIPRKAFIAESIRK